MRSNIYSIWPREGHKLEQLNQFFRCADKRRQVWKLTQRNDKHSNAWQLFTPEAQNGGSRVMLSTTVPACCRHHGFSEKHLATSSQRKAQIESSKQTNPQGRTASVSRETYLSGPLQDHQHAHWFPIEVWKWITNSRWWPIHFCGVMVPLIPHAAKQTNKQKTQQFYFSLQVLFYCFFFVLTLKELKKQTWTKGSQGQVWDRGREPADLAWCQHADNVNSGHLQQLFV